MSLSAPFRYGAVSAAGKTRFSVHAPCAQAVDLCLFDGSHETRIPMNCLGKDWLWEYEGDLSGYSYGYRTHGEWAPERGLWFDPAKLLVDPYATELDRRFMQTSLLSEYGADTAAVVPRAIVPSPQPDVPRSPPVFDRGGLIYELNVRGFTMLHPDVPAHMRGTVAALAHPAIIAHFQKLHISAIELMPIVAWIDERHLPPLNLRNAWGYNPVVPMALDPLLCPGGVAELRDTVATLHAHGIGVILDLVLNHSGESDIHGGIMSLRGLNDAAYAHGPDGALINDTGCGNMLDFGNHSVRDMALATLRHFVRHCGIDGFRFDLATVMARSPAFDPAAPIFGEIAADPWLTDRIFIAEPWDIGPGGYQLGNFPPNWLEWNDRFRDDVRRFWKEEAGIGVLATRIAGSSDIFGPTCRSVNYLASHDGFTLADVVAYEQRHNHDNGEDNRDGHGENFSWNNGCEGPCGDPLVQSRRKVDLRALLGTLFASTGTIMLTAGDEFGRTQHGNNNAYAQDNERFWVDWAGRDTELEDYVAALSRKRMETRRCFVAFPENSQWRSLNGGEMTVEQWESADSQGFCLDAGSTGGGYRLHIDRRKRQVMISF